MVGRHAPCWLRSPYTPGEGGKQEERRGREGEERRRGEKMKVRDEWEKRGNWTGKREREKGSVRQVGGTVCFFFTEHTLPQKGKKKKRGKEESVNREK